MQHAQSRTRSRRWIGRGSLVALAGLAAFGVSPALPALAASWSSPVTLPGSCGSSVAVNQAGAMAAAGTFTASNGTTQAEVCTSPNGTTWQATDLGQGGNAPTSGRSVVVAVTPAGQTVALWESTGSTALEAAVHPAGGSWGAPVTLSHLELPTAGWCSAWMAPGTSSPAGSRAPVTRHRRGSPGWQQQLGAGHGAVDRKRSGRGA